MRTDKAFIVFERDERESELNLVYVEGDKEFIERRPIPILTKAGHIKI